MNNLCFLIAALCLVTFAQSSYARDEQFPRLGWILSECEHKGEMISDFEKGANKGDLEAAYCLGLTYQVHGYESYGMTWLKKAADAGFIKAQREFASTVEGHDVQKAARWYLKAALQNDRLSQGVLGHLMYEQWKLQKKETFLLMTWVWFRIVGYDKFFDTDENGTTLIIHLADLLTAVQRQEATKILSDLQDELGVQPY